MNLNFYDTETTGIVKGFDQILQFGAIRTDDDLQEIDRFEIRSRLLPHVIPSPVALHVTGQNIEDILDEARPSHYEMVRAMRQALGDWSPGVFLGYNSVTFDEEFLRQAFYQTLHPPYLTNTNGNGRADVLNLVRAAATLRPDLLSVPRTEKGRLVFKLDQLAPANGFAHENAHEAMADVEATIHLCRLVRAAVPTLWNRFLRFAKKPPVLDFLIEEEAFLQFEFTGGRHSARAVTRIGASTSQSNVQYCLDLNADLDELRGLDDEQLAKRLAKSPRLVRRLKVNAAPILSPLREAPEFLLGGHTEAELVTRARAIKEDHELIRRIISASEGAESVYEPSPHVEQQLYEGGFWPDSDVRLLEQFHLVAWEDRVTIARRLSDVRLRRLARRLIYFERPDVLGDAERATMAEDVSRRVMGLSEEPGPWLTVPVALESMEKLLPNASGDGLTRLRSYQSHLEVISIPD